MDTIRNQRLRLVATQLKLLRLVENDSDFAAKIGWDRSGLSSTYNGKRSVSEKLINSICDTFDIINPRYLRGEENNMLLSYPDLDAGNFLVCEEEDAAGVMTPTEVPDELATMSARVAELEGQLAAKDKEIEWLRSIVEKLTAR